jgi:hypothetical protein
MQPFKQRETMYLPDLDARFPDHTWVFWVSPTLPTLSALMLPFSLAQRRVNGEAIEPDEERQAETDYFAAISAIVLNTGDSGLDLSTPERARAAFTDESIDVELLGGILTAYVVRLINRRGVLEKKADAPSMPTGAQSSSAPTG